VSTRAGSLRSGARLQLCRTAQHAVMEEVDLAAKRAARLKRAKAEAAPQPSSDVVDPTTSSQGDGRVMSAFRLEPLSIGSEGRPRGVYDCGPPRPPVSRLEMLFFYAYVSVAVGGTILLLGYYWYKVRPQVSAGAPRRWWVAHGDSPATSRSSYDARVPPSSPLRALSRVHRIHLSTRRVGLPGWRHTTTLSID
jgi:hypothetical protein